jgi:hypothetical protein
MDKDMSDTLWDYILSNTVIDSDDFNKKLILLAKKGDYLKQTLKILYNRGSNYAFMWLKAKIIKRNDAIKTLKYYETLKMQKISDLSLKLVTIVNYITGDKGFDALVCRKNVVVPNYTHDLIALYRTLVKRNVKYEMILSLYSVPNSIFAIHTKRMKNLISKDERKIKANNETILRIMHEFTVRHYKSRKIQRLSHKNNAYINQIALIKGLLSG